MGYDKARNGYSDSFDLVYIDLKCYGDCHTFRSCSSSPPSWVVGGGGFEEDDDPDALLGSSTSSSSEESFASGRILLGS